MSFVFSEAKRELNFFHNARPSLGPTIGPGSYYSESAIKS